VLLLWVLTSAASALLGTTHPSAGTSALFTSTHAAYERLQLREDQTVLETASIR